MAFLLLSRGPHVQLQVTATTSIPLEPLEKTGQELSHATSSSVKRSQPASQEPWCPHTFTDKDPEHRKEMPPDHVSAELGLTTASSLIWSAQVFELFRSLSFVFFFETSLLSGCLQTHYVAEGGTEPVTSCLDSLRPGVTRLCQHSSGLLFVWLVFWLVGLVV